MKIPLRTTISASRIHIDVAGLRPLSSPDLEAFQQCSIRNLLSTGLYFLENAAPVSVAEYQKRRDRLAEALVADEVDAFVVEPGYTFKYYANVSQPEWEVWEVSLSKLNMFLQFVWYNVYMHTHSDIICLMHTI